MTTQWRLPEFFYPASEETAMTYHQKMERWSMSDSGCYLKSAARGQEFVLEVAHQPAAMDWVNSLLKGVNA